MIWFAPVLVVGVSGSGLLQPVAFADVLTLRPDGRIEGQLLNPDRQPEEAYRFRTDDGVDLTLAPKQVKRLILDSPAERRYREYLPRMPATAEGNWKMAEWCAKHKLSRRRKFHLEQVIELDPNHEKAHRLLGYVQVEGEWTLPADRMRQRGYVRHRGDWMLPQEKTLAESSQQYDAAVTQWKNDLKMWMGWLRGRRHDEAIAKIEAIDDPLAAGAISELFSKSNAVVRLMYVEVLDRLRTETSVMALVRAALEDSVEEIRLASLDSLRRYGGIQAVPAFTERLRSSDNELVRRAAVALGQVGDQRAISPLIDALVTEHKQKIGGGNPGAIGIGFGDPRSGNGGNTLSAGGRPIIRKAHVKNREVLDALVSLTDQSNYQLQYDKESWRNWYADQTTPRGINLRRL